MAKKPDHHIYELLPFVRNPKTKAEKAEHEKWGACVGGASLDFWHVEPTGEFARDRALGHGYAWEAMDMALGYRHAHQEPPEGLIVHVVADMVRHGRWGDVEWGFVHMLAGLATMPVRIIKGQQPSAGKFCVLTPMLPGEGDGTRGLPSRRTIATVDD
jgi:hypothetical protein